MTERRAGADLDRVYRADVTHPSGLRGELTLPNDLRELEDAIREHDVGKSYSCSPGHHDLAEIPASRMTSVGGN